MKITHAQTHAVRPPPSGLLGDDGPRDRVPRDVVVLELDTDAGLTGIGLTLFGGPLTPVLHKAVSTLAALTVGLDPLPIEALRLKLLGAAGFSGPPGIFTLALAAIDCALWDLAGKAANLPLATLLGGARERVPTYASGALGRDLPLDVLAHTAARLVQCGFRQIKLQLGGAATTAAEVERVRVVREAVGLDVVVLADVNQRWSVKQAISVGHQLAPFQLGWLEDPIAHEDIEGLAQVAAALPMPIATGEYHYGISPFRRLLSSRAVDIVMIDLARVGGITPWRKVAALAEAFEVPVVSHVLPEIHVHLVAGAPNGFVVEYMPWTLALFERTPEFITGELLVPQRPGLGLALDRDALNRYALPKG